MICPNCGREIPDGSICPCSLAARPLSDNPAVNVIKTVGSSGQFLAMAILFSASALLTIFSSIGIPQMLFSFYEYAMEMGIDPELAYMITSGARSSAVTNAIASSVPAILIGIAMWIHYCSSRSTNTGNISTAGLTICKALAYIYMVLLCFVAFCIVAVLAIAIIGILSGEFSDLMFVPQYSYSDDELTLAVIILFALIAAFSLFIFTLMITYNASIIRMINRTKLVAQSGMADDRVSSYLIGMNYVSAGISLIFGLITLASAPIAGLADICNALALVMSSLLLSRYRKEMNQVLFPPVQPVQPVQPMQPPIPPTMNMPAQPSAPTTAPQEGSAPEPQDQGNIEP